MPREEWGAPTTGLARTGASHARPSERILETLVNSLSDHAVFALDVDGNVLTWNPGAERLKGYRAEEIIGRHFSRFYTAADIAAAKPERELAIAVADGHYEEEGWRVRNDGTLFWASVGITALRAPDGRLLGFGKVTRDLTDRKRAEEALRDSEERFRLLVTSVADYAIFLLDPDGRIASWNVGAERLKGYRADEIIGRHISGFYTEDDRRAGVPAAGLAEAKAEGRWETEGWRVRKDGSRFWANVVLTSLVSSHGEHRGFAKVTRDLTDRKRSEDALRGVLEREREAAEQLRDADRIRSELVSIVAHDLRAPAGVIQHLLHSLREDWSESDDADKLELLGRIGARAAQMASLAEDLFDLALIDAGRLRVGRQPFDLGAAVDQVLADVGDEASRVIREETGRVVVALGDDRRSWQVLTNLVSNALKFSPMDSKVDVLVRYVGDEAVVAITDRGPGIPSDQVEQLFERFARLPQSDDRPGTGIGLFIARSLAEAQGGRIEVESTQGEGSSFSFVLPAAS